MESVRGGLPAEANTASRTRVPARFGVLVVVFFLIATGLGYATLNRYDPRRAGTPDAVSYYALVAGPMEAINGFQRYRVLTPYMAKPIFWLARGRVGSWDPTALALLTVNALFVAMTAALMLSLARASGKNALVGVLGSCLYLLNFNVANGQLAGLVDAGEAFFLLLIVFALLAVKPPVLLVAAILGPLAKETFVPLAAALMLAWVGVRWRQRRTAPREAAWVCLSIGASLATVVALRFAVNGYFVLPWSLVGEFQRPRGMIGGLLGTLGPQMVYVFSWLAPLGLVGARDLPRSWLVATGVACGVALLLGGFNDSGGNVARALFDIAGPLLSLGAAQSVAALLSTGATESRRGNDREASRSALASAFGVDR